MTRGKRILSLAAAILLCGFHMSCALAEPKAVASASLSSHERDEDNQSPFGRWTYLVERLKSDGVPDDLLALYRDPNFPEYTPIPFKVKPREHAESYVGFYAKQKIKDARAYLEQHKVIFSHVEKTLHVDRRVIAAILLIESNLGRGAGTHLVLFRLSRLAALDEPKNVIENFKNLREEDPKVRFEEVQARAHWLFRTFYPELLALFRMAEHEQVDLLKLKGSIAGAFGMPQFLPTSFLRFGKDGDGDGIISLYKDEDAISSVANFLSYFGWNNKLPRAARHGVLLHYNNSDAYADAVLNVASML